MESRNLVPRSWDIALANLLRASRLSKARGSSEMGTPVATGGLGSRSPMYTAARNLLAACVGKMGLGPSPTGTPTGTPPGPAVAAEGTGSGIPFPTEGNQGGAPLPTATPSA